METKLDPQRVKAYLGGEAPSTSDTAEVLRFLTYILGGPKSATLDLAQGLRLLQNARQRYLDTFHLEENRNKLFSVHTGRWRIKTTVKKTFATTPTERLYATDAKILQTYMTYIYMPPTSLPGTVPGSSAPLPSPLLGGAASGGVSIKAIAVLGPEVKCIVGAPKKEVASPKEIPKESWAKVRINTWFHEQSRLEAMGHKNYFDKDAGKCFACLEPVTIKTFEAAHIVPRCKGGQDTVENLRVACAKCNHGTGGMGTMHAYEWLLHTNKPGLQYMTYTDREFLVATLLHREALILVAVLDGTKVPNDAAVKTKATAPLEHRLTTTWQLLCERLPRLARPASPPAPPKGGSSGGCLLM